MNDKELLELAAKAAGIASDLVKRRYYGNDGRQYLEYWNPLTDDGDALRLAVKLASHEAMSLTWQGGLVRYAKPQAAPIWAVEDGRFDPYAATRRAIVSAAAEIGNEVGK